MQVFAVWMKDGYDSRNLMGLFFEEADAKAWIEINVERCDKPLTYVEAEMVE